MATKIMIIRHGEKPVKKDKVRGLTPTGSRSKNELSLQGWQRSGALIRLFNPLNKKCPHPGLAVPDVIIAEDPRTHIHSKRPLHTVSALARSLKIKPVLRYTKGQEPHLVAFAEKQKGVVLICWEHHFIVDIANIILSSENSCPQKWRGSRFDLVWVFDFQVGGKVKFSQVPQLLLPTDIDGPM